VFHVGSHGAASGRAGAGVPYKLYKDGDLLEEGHADKAGSIQFAHDLETQARYKLELPNGQVFQIAPGPLDTDHAASSALGYHGYTNPGGSLSDSHAVLEKDRLLANPAVDES
jgi:type VI secretion system secreted protein VgrG